MQQQIDIDKEVQDNTIAKMLTDQNMILTKLSADIDEIKTQNAQMQLTNAEIRKANEEIVTSMGFLNNKFEDLKKEVEELRKERLELGQYIGTLEKKVQDLQRMTRSAGIEIRNLPQPSNESTTGLAKTVCNIGEAVGLHISESELRDVYRLPGKSPATSTSPRPIIVEFTTVQKKQTLISAVRSYNKDKGKDDKMNTSIIGISGPRHPVYIADHLPLSTKKLFYQAREFAKTNGYKFCWISNENIFLRKLEGDKQILIHSEKSLHDVKNTNK